jgi:5-methyltetrahydrofolate--homocysteine methyltransferase
MDGALGTQLLAHGLPPGTSTAQANRTHPGLVLRIHRAYVQARARVLLTNTFLAHPDALPDPDELQEVILRAIGLARQAAGPSRHVLASIGPPGREGQDFPDREALGRLLECFVDTPLEVDGFLLETCSSPSALAAIDYARHRVPGVGGQPFLLSLAYHHAAHGRLLTRSGHAPETYARHAARHGVDVLGVNCGRDIDLEDILEIVRRYRDQTDLPLLVRPNAGTPRAQGDGWVWPLQPEALAERVPELLAAGVRLFGGCCGTTPDHIAALAGVLPGQTLRGPEGKS